MGYLSGGGNTQDGNAILGHVLGGNRKKVQRGISRSSGLDVGQIGQLLAVLAPVVPGGLGRTQRQGGLDAGGLSALLGGEAKQVEDRLGSGGLGSLLGALGAGGGRGGLMDMLGGLLGRR